MFRFSRVLSWAPDEQLWRVVHKASFRFVGRLVFAGALLILPFSFMFTWMAMGAVGWLLAGFVFGLGFVLAWYAFWTWQNNVFIITSRRCVDVRSQHPWKRDIYEFSWSQIQEIRIERSWRKPGWGDWRILASSSPSEWVVKDIFRPRVLCHWLERHTEIWSEGAHGEKLLAKIKEMDQGWLAKVEELFF